MKFYNVKTIAQVNEALKQIPNVVAIDTEYVKGNPRTTKLLSIQIADADRAWYFSEDVFHEFSVPLKRLIESRKAIFLQDHNHCDTIILYKHGIDIRDANTHNLIDMHHLIDENVDHSLDNRIKENFDDSYKENFWAKYQNFEDASEQDAVEYACKDAIYAYRLAVMDYRFLNGSKSDLYNHVRSLSRSLLDTKLNGLKVNVELMQQTKDKLTKEIAEFLPKLRNEFYEYTELWEIQEWNKEISKRKSEHGRLRVPRPIFNFDSDRQIAWLVYEALKCEVITKTKAGNPATDQETIQTLSESFPALKLFSSYKETKALYSTFVEGMLERVENERIYPQFNTSGTATGRISHSDPNMGNLPRSGTIRNFFIPDDDMVIIGADYSQLEVVIEANLTDDPNLLKIINEGASKHDITASGLGVDRNAAKTLNFALQYGAGVGKVAKILGVSKQEAEIVYERYWDLYSGVRSLKEKVNKEIEETGQITNLAGRTRHFPKPQNKWEMFKQQRQAYNFLIQGVAAECCNRAFYRFAEKSSKIGAKALFSVHDEIVAQVRSDENGRYVDNAMAWLTQIMEDVSKDFNFKYPLKAVAYGPLDKWDKT